MSEMISDRLRKLRSRCLGRIEQAAKSADAAAVLEQTRMLNEIEGLIKKYQQLESSLQALENSGASGSPVTAGNDGHLHSFSATIDGEQREQSYKKLGERRRDDFVKLLVEKGIHLLRQRGVIYRKNNSIVGIASASERNANRWFLGLPPNSFAVVILLCEITTGEVLRFFLNSNVLSRIRNRLTKNRNGQLMFNVTREYQHYYLKIPPRDEIEISKCLDDFDALQKL